MQTWYRVRYGCHIFPIHPVLIVQTYTGREEVVLEEDEEGNKGPVRRPFRQYDLPGGNLVVSYHSTWRQAKAALVAERQSRLQKAQGRVDWCRNRLRRAQELQLQPYLETLR